MGLIITRMQEATILGAYSIIYMKNIPNFIAIKVRIFSPPNFIESTIIAAKIEEKYL